jgi:hypothetical protein
MGVKVTSVQRSRPEWPQDPESRAQDDEVVTERIDAAIASLDRQEFAPEEEVEAFFRKWRSLPR